MCAALKRSRVVGWAACRRHRVWMQTWGKINLICSNWHFLWPQKWGTGTGVLWVNCCVQIAHVAAVCIEHRDTFCTVCLWKSWAEMCYCVDITCAVTLSPHGVIPYSLLIQKPFWISCRTPFLYFCFYEPEGSWTDGSCLFLLVPLLLLFVCLSN